ncbi:hypothetical protein TMatcc_000011 [Talaromyces marneffei ATCC 18224]
MNQLGFDTGTKPGDSYNTKASEVLRGAFSDSSVCLFTPHSHLSEPTSLLWRPWRLPTLERMFLGPLRGLDKTCAFAFMVGLLASPSDLSLNLSSTAAKSPFVIAIKNAGIPALPSIINAAILTSAWSSGCADLFVSSRTLYGLAARGHAPKIFLKTRKDGLPWVSVIFCGAFSLLSFMAASKGEEGTVFGYCKNFPLALIPWDILARFPV